MGETEYGITLVEAHHPFSCGWYGSQQEEDLYIKWITNGWAFLNNEIKNTKEKL